MRSGSSLVAGLLIMRKRKYLQMYGAVCTIMIMSNTPMQMNGKKQSRKQELKAPPQVLSRTSDITGSN